MTPRLLLIHFLVLSAYATPTCYDPRQMRAKMNKISIIDCADVLEQMLGGSNVTQPSLWSSADDSSSKSWFSHTCVVTASLIDGYPWTLASYDSVATTALGIMKACVSTLTSPNIGGQDTVANLTVSLTGQRQKPRYDLGLRRALGSIR